MSQQLRCKAPYSGRRRGVLCAVAATAAWTVAFSGSATAATITDPQSKQWYLDAMNAEKIWKSATGDGVTVAVIDGGVNPSTPSLRGQVLKGVDFTGVKGEASDDLDGHGTSMAELIAGTGKGGGLKGLAPGAKILPFRVSDTELQNKERVNAFDMQQAIRAAADSDAKIINISLAGDYYSSEVRDAVEYAQMKGKLLFAGAGNNAKKGNKEQYPASYPEAIAVAGSGPDGKVADYSQHGDTIDIAAPADDIPGWCDQSFTNYCDGDGGTSSATAIASATAALIWSKHPDWTGNQVLRVMFESAGRGKDWEPGSVSRYLGHGIVRPGAHINRGLGKPGDPDITPLTNERVGPPQASKAPSAPASSQPKEGGKPGSDAVAAGSSKDAAKQSDGDGTSVLVIGAVAAVAVLAGAAYAIVRRRRTA
ncbi:S8 family serine peptidase [Streptomyces ficellus]|uniref:Serine protease n=1 Tax=Streptomyces ficellus TaxID=1977088 RepID=A0A6I6F5I4_9ACTN|nr:S8 family serine peptidase [Streptomyces ficellus]QGV78181.1 serine protease [Streptomyces ficellus]